MLVVVAKGQPSAIPLWLLFSGQDVGTREG